MVSNICLFSPLELGGMIQFDEHIFQRGWFNHQLDRVVYFNFLFETTSWVVVCYWKLQRHKMIWESDAKEVQTLCFTPNKSKDLNILIILDLFYLSLYGVGFFSSKKTPKKPRFPIPFPSLRKDASLANVSRVHWILAHRDYWDPGPLGIINQS